MKRKLSLLLGILLLVGSVLMGCQGKDSGDGGDYVTIELWNNLASGQTFFPKLIDEFEEKNPGIKVELNNVNVESSDAEYQAAISDDSLPDMFITDAFSMNELVDLDLVHELNEVFPEDVQKEYTEGVFDIGNTRVGDDIYLFPIFKGGTYMLYYNKEVLDELGIDKVPETWDDLNEIGQEIYNTSNGSTHGLIFGGTSGWLVNAVTQLMATELSPESGFDFIEGDYKYSTEGHIELMKFFKNMLDNNALSELSLENSSTVARELFAVGQATFLIDGNWTGQLLSEENEFDDWGVIELPTKNPNGKLHGEFGLGSNDGLYVSKKTEHWDEVKLFLDFLQENIYAELVEVGEATIAKEFDLVEAEAPFEQITEIQTIFTETSITTPNAVVVNPKAMEVQLEVRKNAPDLNPGQILMGYLTGQVKDLEGTLKKYNDDYNKAFDDALDSVEGISREDFQFSNWVPYEPYTQEDYNQR